MPQLGQLHHKAEQTIRINSYISGYGAYEFLLSSNNANATIEITDYQFGGTKTEMLRLTPAGYANTAILVRPNDLYHTGYGFRYILQGRFLKNVQEIINEAVVK